MKLQDKIYYCRKKAGLSQEALAAQIGVSRQAISKWETGDAEPEINKLRLLATAFNVSIDWLLSEDEPEDNKAAEPEADNNQPASGSNWVESIPGVLGKLISKFGWLFGVYLAICGAAFTGFGALARYTSRRMMTSFTEGMGSMDSMISGGTIYYDQFSQQMDNTFSGFATNNPVYIAGGVIMVFGIILMLAGIVFAIILKNHSKGK